MLTRRQFLTRALAAVPVVMATPALIEALTPTRTIFLPPAGGWLTANEEMSYIIRRAFVGKLVANIYNTSPLTRALLGVQFVPLPHQLEPDDRAVEERPGAHRHEEATQRRGLDFEPQPIPVSHR